MERELVGKKGFKCLVLAFGLSSGSAFAQAVCTVDYRFANDWGAGATHEVRVSYGGPAINSWQLSWEFPGSEQITNLWNGHYSQVGQSVDVENMSWNGSLKEGSQIYLGFNLNAPSGQIPAILLNGIACNGGDAQPPDPIDPDPIDPDPAITAWTLDAAASYLNFLSIKNLHIVEASRFESLAGSILSDGLARLDVDLSSVNTGIETRDGRMRNLLFQTDQFPQAVVTLPVNLDEIESIPVGENITVDSSAELQLHGISGTVTSQLLVQRLSASRILVRNVAPVLLYAGDYALEAGVEELRQVAGLQVISTTIPIDFVLLFDAL